MAGGGGFGRTGGFGNFARHGLTLPKGFTLPNGTRLHNQITLPPGFFQHRSGGSAGAPGAGGFGRFGGGAGGGGFGGGGFGGRGGPPGGGGGNGGLLNAGTPGKQIVALLEDGASRYTWIAATTGSNSASGYQLATDDPVMAIGGFNGTDPAPTLAEFKRYVAEGKIHYYISGGGGFGGGFGGTSSGSSDASQIASWVTSTFTATSVDGVTVYDLTAGRQTAP